MEEGVLKEKAPEAKLSLPFSICSELAQHACNGRIVLQIPSIYVIIKPIFVLFKEYNFVMA